MTDQAGQPVDLPFLFGWVMMMPMGTIVIMNVLMSMLMGFHVSFLLCALLPGQASRGPCAVL